ncbi:3-hydroxyacyl-CoA dehydrogenase family protein [Chloroflexota bacterium]
MVVKLDQIKKVGVVGAGTMGHGIAQSYAQEGYPVSITDSSKSALASVKDRIKANLETLAQEELLRQNDVEQVLDRISVTNNLEEAIRDVNFVTEAIIEDLDKKRELFQQMENFCSPESILASNTSSFPMTQISALMERPERAIVTHWMIPPHLVPLVEIVPGEKTSEETYRTASELLRKIKKVTVRLQKEVTGFIINRVQTAMNREVYHLLEMGAASAEDIDLAIVTSLGFRLATIGSLRIRDLAGLDVTYKVDETLLGEISSSTAVSKLLKDKVSKGELGTKTGKGFFEYPPESLAEFMRERDRQFIQRLKKHYLSQE